MSRDEALRLIREKGSYTLPPLKAWNQEHKLRKFQEVGAIHLVIKKRFILGDPVGSGKTPQSLYAWGVVREGRIDSGQPSRLWVIAKKSATLQWQGEVKKFLPSVKTHRLVTESGREGRLKTFKQWLNDKSGAVLLSNWSQFRDDWEGVKEMGDLSWLKETQITLDECLFRTQKVRLPGGREKTIFEVVTGDEEYVESWNEEKQEWESRRILRKLRNARRGRRILKIKLESWAEGTSSLICSENHVILKTSKGDIQACEVEPGDKLSVQALLPTADQKQIIWGGLLGDQSLSRTPKGACRLEFKQGVKQKDYFDWKLSQLETLGCGRPYLDPNGKGYGGPIWASRVRCLRYFNSVFDKVYCGRKRTVNELWLQKIDARGLAVWFCDDGSMGFYTHKSIRKRRGCDQKGVIGKRVASYASFATHCFTKEENELLCAWLKEKWDIEVEVKKDKKERGEGYFIGMNSVNAEKLRELIQDYVPISMKHKVDGRGQDLWEVLQEPKQGLVLSEVESVKELKGYKTYDNDNWLFNIEVEGNHNFSAKGILVSNCHKAKNPESKLGKVTREIVVQADRVHALTATLVQNKAHDAYEVAKMIDPGILALPTFEKLYCTKEDVWLYRKGRRIKVQNVVDYHHLKEFKEKIAHIYLGREDDEIDMERPDVVHMTRTTTLPPDQRKVYLQAERGVFIESDHKAVAAAMTQAFLAASLPVHYDAKIKKNAKAELLEELLDDEMQGQPVLVYTSYRTVVDAYMKHFAKRNPVRITGSDSDEERAKAQKAFQEGKTNLIFITDAGGESINLQKAAHVVMLSRPWAPGSYAQVVGRARRFGSEHKKITVWHLSAEDTVDEYADGVLLRKFGPVEDIVQGRGNLLPDDQVLSLEIANYARRRRTQDAKV